MKEKINMLCKKCGKETESSRSICKGCQGALNSNKQTSNSLILCNALNQYPMFGYLVAMISLIIATVSIIGFFKFPLIILENGNVEKTMSFADVCIGETFEIFFDVLLEAVHGHIKGGTNQFIISITFICLVCIIINIIMLIVAIIKLLLKDIRFSCRMISYSILFTGLLRLFLVLIAKMEQNESKEFVLFNIHTDKSLYFMIIFCIVSFLAILWIAEIHIKNPRKQ